MGNGRERVKQANYLKIDGVFELLGAGFEELNESPGAKSVSKRYINDKSETKTITGYDWSSDYSLDQIRSEKAIEFICNIGELLLTGSNCETDYVIVDLDRPGSIGNTFRARKIKVAIEVKDFKSKDGEMQGSGSFLGKGDLIEGTFDTTTREFTEVWTEPALGTLTVTSTAGTLSGDTKITVAPTLTSGNSYVYKTGTTVTLPNYNEILTTGYNAWNGTADITAATGNQILIVEVDSSSKAKKAGIATVTAKA
jgi:hypothetical protein